MTIGVTGAAGFLGANLLRYLHGRAADRGDRLVAFYSRRRHNPLTEPLGLAAEHLDVTCREEVLEKTRGIELLFHLAGVIEYSRRNTQRAWEVNVLGTRNVLEAALRNRIRKLICVSSICVLGTCPPDAPPAGESNPIYGVPDNPISFRDRPDVLAAIQASLAGDYSFCRAVRVPYFDSKLAAYELAREYHRAHGLPVVVVCPGTVVGAGDVGVSITKLVYRVFTNRLMFTLPGGTSFVSAADVSAGIWLSCLEGRIGESYILTGTEQDNLSYRQFMELVATVSRECYGKPVRSRFATVPAAMARPLARVAGAVLPAGELNEGLVLSGSVFQRFSNRKASRELGYAPQVALRQSIKECLDFHLCREQERTR